MNRKLVSFLIILLMIFNLSFSTLAESLDDKKDEIFKSYTRRNNSPDRDKGMGIGLSICQTIIEAHNGEIHADTHDEGSVFYFSLPKED